MNQDAAELYRSMGVRPIVNAAGPISVYGGGKARPEVISTVSKAFKTPVHLHELNRRASEIIAETGGCRGGLRIQRSGGWTGPPGGSLHRGDRRGQDAAPARQHRHEERDRHSEVPALLVHPELSCRRRHTRRGGRRRRLQPRTAGGCLQRQHGRGRLPVRRPLLQECAALRRVPRLRTLQGRPIDSRRRELSPAAGQHEALHGRGRRHGRVQRRQGGTRPTGRGDPAGAGPT